MPPVVVTTIDAYYTNTAHFGPSLSTTATFTHMHSAYPGSAHFRMRPVFLSALPMVLAPLVLALLAARHVSGFGQHDLAMSAFLGPSRHSGLSRLPQRQQHQQYQQRRSPYLAMTATGEDEWVFDVLFTGTGQSSSVPLLKHAVRGTCKVCNDALLRPGSKNKYEG
jgi:hypothetical protein